MNKTLTTITYQCAYCSSLRTISIDPQQVEKQLKSPMSSGIVQIIDAHICINNAPKFIALEIDGSLAVRKQHVIEPVNKKQTFGGENEFQIPTPNTPTITITTNHIQVTQLTLKTSKNEEQEPYIRYKDKKNNLVIEINIKNKPEIIHSDDNDVLEIWADTNDNRINQWIMLLKNVNEVIMPSNPDLILYQFLLIQKKLLQNQSPTAHNTQELMQVVLLPEIKILTTDQDAPEIFELFGNSIITNEKQFDIAKNILKAVNNGPTSLNTVISPLINEKHDLLELLQIINKLNQYGLIEIKY